MQLFILRHGHAEPQKTTDEMRNLSITGARDVAAMTARSLADLRSLQQVWVSPLLRAQQTAEIVSNELKKSAINFSMRTSDLIMPEANSALLFNALQSAHCETILLISHQPLVGRFIDLFCGSHPACHAMNTSSMACIDYEVAASGLGSLRWLRHAHA